MRRHVAALAAALTPLLAAPALAAPGDGLYLEGHAGYSFPEQLDVDGEAGDLGLGFDGDIELDDTYVFGGAVGYGFGTGVGRVRLEANVSWRESDLDGIEVGGFDLDGDGEAKALVGLVNAYYDLELGLPLRPYVGGGIGAARVSIDSDGGGLLDLDDEGDAFAWNLAAGLSYDLTANLALTAGYRYLRIEGTDFDIDVGPLGSGELDVDAFASHEALLGLRLGF